MSVFKRTVMFSMWATNCLKNAFQFDLQSRSETHVRFAIVQLTGLLMWFNSCYLQVGELDNKKTNCTSLLHPLPHLHQQVIRMRVIIMAELKRWTHKGTAGSAPRPTACSPHPHEGTDTAASRAWHSALLCTWLLWTMHIQIVQKTYCPFWKAVMPEIQKNP